MYAVIYFYTKMPTLFIRHALPLGQQNDVYESFFCMYFNGI